MKATTFTVATVAMIAILAPSIVEAGDGARLYRKPHWRGAYGYDARLARIAPPVVSVVTPDLSYPVARYVDNRLDDGYDYPFGYGEYAIYGKWARDAYGRPDVTRCRLVWFDGPRLRSLNRCN
ncbi:hypothetical protein [Bradyrhizobium sp. WSM3983]|uniref:hypothetical protein n=1 Tax=Bradyrhizobium sp. WSM3983 TaxID=1038867 RepID=UPI0004067678|nr:hypothetical protein [Bradyrhizobium sp. WSM3983]